MTALVWFISHRPPLAAHRAAGLCSSSTPLDAPRRTSLLSANQEMANHREAKYSKFILLVISFGVKKEAIREHIPVLGRPPQVNVVLN
jgi:hypothetical protein